jgi:hypothetical protein
LYSLQAHVTSEETVYLATFDFRGELLPALLGKYSHENAVGIGESLSRHPVSLHIESDAHPRVTIRARLGTMLENDREHYIPLEVISFE